MKKELKLDLCIEILNKRKGIRFRVFGNSMFPSIRSNDIIYVERVSPKDIMIGDIIFFHHDNRFFAHRVRKKKKINDDIVLFVTRGDFNLSFDPAIYSPQVLGKVMSIERQGRAVELYTPFQKIKGYLIALLISRPYFLFLKIIKKLKFFR